MADNESSKKTKSTEQTESSEHREEETEEASLQERADSEGTASPRMTRRAGRSGTAVSESDDGVTIIHDEVVAKIAQVAAREVQGVHRLVAQGAGQQIASMARSVSGSEDRESGVAVEVGTEEAAVDVRIESDYGASIPQIAQAIRRNVGERIESMTGLSVVEINVEVVDLHFAEDETDDDERGGQGQQQQQQQQQRVR